MFFWLMLLQQLLPHLPLNDQFDSVIFLRNDDSETITVQLDFFNEAGTATTVTVSDLQNSVMTGSSISLQLNANQVRKLQLTDIGAQNRSVHAMLTAQKAGTGEEVDGIFAETWFSAKNAGGKTALVGVSNAQEMESFRLTVDGSSDDEGEPRITGVAIVNAGDESCTCQFNLVWDEQVQDQAERTIAAKAKLLETASSLFSAEIGQPAFISVRCSAPVNPLGLIFEGSLMGSLAVQSAPFVSGEQGGNTTRQLPEMELSFDGGPDGSGYEDGMQAIYNTANYGSVQPTFVGGAHRSNLGQGVQGRAAVFTGSGSSVTFSDTTSSSNRAFTLQLWVMQQGDGWLFQIPGSIGFHLEQGQLRYAYNDGGETEYIFMDSGIRIQNDGLFHHLEVVYSGNEQGPRSVSFTLDFDQTGRLADLPVPLESRAEPLLGADFTGMIDEVYLADSGRPEISRNPNFQVNGMIVREESFTTTPDNWPFPQEVRIKVFYDPQQCTTDSPCPLLISMQGGGVCNDDFEGKTIMQSFANAGFITATVDPYCEASDRFNRDMEVDQLAAAETFLRTQSAVAPLIEEGDFYASGCSHGATMVAHWLITRENGPKRVFARSAQLAIHCNQHFNGCANSEEIGEHDDSRADAAALYHQFDLWDKLDAELVATHELGLSWGRSTMAGDDCACFEEAAGFNYGSRLMRDSWQSLEPQASPTGFFFVDDQVPCNHCISTGGANAAMWQCVLCFLVNGRAAMEQACPDCLTLSQGETVLPCAITCSENDGCLVTGGD